MREVGYVHFLSMVNTNILWLLNYRENVVMFSISSYVFGMNCIVFSIIDFAKTMLIIQHLPVSLNKTKHM